MKESEVARQIIDYCALYGFVAHRTPSDLLTLNHHPMRIYPEGHPDYVFMRPVSFGRLDAFYLEVKRPKATTKLSRKIKQIDWATDAGKRGFLVCRMPDGLADPFAWFKAWFEAAWIREKAA